MKTRTPQEKKQLSLKKDRRNAYGESPHGARKSIPRRKRFQSRKERHAAKIPLAKIDDDAVAVDEVVARAGQKHKARRWSKVPDEPLETVLQHKIARRERLQLEPRKRASVERVSRRSGPRAQLQLFDGRRHQILPIHDAVTLGGRRAAIQVPGSTITRVHARISLVDGQFWIEDLGGDGVWVNGVRVTRQALANGDPLRVGSLRLQYFER